MPVRVIAGDCRTALQELPSESVHCILTSPPYYGLRDYGTATWEGGDPACDHKQGRNGSGRADGKVDERGQRNRDGVGSMGGDCRRCGARRVDRQIGLEASPEAYVAELVSVFREARRVLRDDGVLWIVIGDSYAGSWGNQGRKDTRGTQRPINGAMIQPVRDDRYPSNGSGTGRIPQGSGLKPKDLIGIPWMVAFALRADGWYLRSDNIWNKPNPMPESVTDRTTRSHEYVFMFSKTQRYFYDAVAVSEPSCNNGSRPQAKRAHELAEEAGLTPDHIAAIRAVGATDAGKARVTQDGYGKNTQRVARLADEAKAALGGYYREFLIAQNRNKRSVWTIATEPSGIAHYAMMPTALAEICIKAGTSERGCCPHCGAGWVREVEKHRFRDGEPITGSWNSATDHRIGPTGIGHWRDTQETRTVGWSQSCACPAHDPVPATVLDPFAGAGTTGVVADRLGRSAILIELSETNAAMARNRLERDAGLFAEVSAG